MLVAFAPFVAKEWRLRPSGENSSRSRSDLEEFLLTVSAWSKLRSVSATASAHHSQMVDWSHKICRGRLGADLSCTSGEGYTTRNCARQPTNSTTTTPPNNHEQQQQQQQQQPTTTAPTRTTDNNIGSSNTTNTNTNNHDNQPTEGNNDFPRRFNNLSDMHVTARYKNVTEYHSGDIATAHIGGTRCTAAGWTRIKTKTYPAKYFKASSMCLKRLRVQ